MKDVEEDWRKFETSLHKILDKKIENKTNVELKKGRRAGGMMAQKK